MQFKNGSMVFCSIKALDGVSKINSAAKLYVREGVFPSKKFKMNIIGIIAHLMNPCSVEESVPENIGKLCLKKKKKKGNKMTSRLISGNTQPPC